MIWGFAWLFWLVPLFFFFALMRGARWALGYGGCGGWLGDRNTMHRGRRNRQSFQDSQDSYVEELERRISDLEEKLEFTERLVSGRKDG